MTKFSINSKNPIFGLFLVHFPNFGGKKLFPENLSTLHTTSYRFLAPWQNLEKIMTQFKENPQADRRADRRMDGTTERPTEGQTGQKEAQIDPIL